MKVFTDELLRTNLQEKNDYIFLCTLNTINPIALKLFVPYMVYNVLNHQWL